MSNALKTEAILDRLTLLTANRATEMLLKGSVEAGSIDFFQPKFSFPTPQ